MIATRRAVLFTVLLAVTPAASWALPEPLLPAEREKLRYRLETQINELELLIVNEKADRSDLARQARERQALKVEERIPFKPDLEGLQRNLAATAKGKGLKLTGFRALPRAKRAPRPPATVYADDSNRFRLGFEQVAEAVPFEAVVSASSARKVQGWVDSWREEQMRLAEPRAPIVSAGRGKWRVKGQAFRYYADVNFPRIQVREPAALLPAKAKGDASLRALADKIHELAPRATPLYENRREFLLSDARMTFFLSKALPPRFAQSSAAAR